MVGLTSARVLIHEGGAPWLRAGRVPTLGRSGVVAHIADTLPLLHWTPVEPDGHVTDGRYEIRSDSEVLARHDDIALLRAVQAGEVVRGADGHSTSINAPHLWKGSVVSLVISRLAREDLLFANISGPPVLAPRGRRLLAVANSEESLLRDE
jgi:hypothetical protein